MDTRIVPLTAFGAAIGARLPHRFEEIVKDAYEAGAGREDLLLVVDSARLLVSLPAPLVELAYAAIHKWHWMESRRTWQQRNWPSVAA